MVNIRNFLRDVKKASRGHKISSVGIEFGSSSIKLVHLVEDKGVVNLKNYGEIDLGPFIEQPTGSVANLDMDKLQEAMMNLLQNVPIGKPEAVSVAIPLSAALVIPLDVPNTDNDAEFEGKVIEMIKGHVPVPLTQVYVDWQRVHGDTLSNPIIGESSNLYELESNAAKVPDSQTAVGSSPAAPASNQEVKVGTTKVICFVINKEIIDTYRRVLSNLGFEIEYFELEIYSVMRAAVPNDTQDAIVIDIGARYTKLYILRNGEILEAVKKLQGGQDYTAVIKDELKVGTQKAEDLKRSVYLDSLEGTAVVKKIEASLGSLVTKVKQMKTEFNVADTVPIYVCGGGSLLYGLPEYLAKTLQAKIVICQPFVNTSAPEYLDKLLVETGPEYTVAAGLALKHIRTV